MNVYFKSSLASYVCINGFGMFPRLVWGGSTRLGWVLGLMLLYCTRGWVHGEATLMHLERRKGLTETGGTGTRPIGVEGLVSIGGVEIEI